MTTVSTALKTYDSFSRSLQQVTQNMNITIDVMKEMTGEATVGTKLAAQMHIACSKVEQVETAFQQVIEKQEQMTSKQSQVNNAISQGTNASTGILSKIKGIAGKCDLLGAAVKKGVEQAIGGAAKLEQQLISLSGILGNKNAGRAFFENLNAYANTSAHGMEAFTSITRQFIPFTKNPERLMSLNKMAERLAFLDPDQGLEGAGSVLKEALGGDFMSLEGHFGFESQDSEFLQTAKSMDDFINKFDILLEKKGATQQAIDELNHSAIAQFNNLGSNIEASFSRSGEKALEVLKPILQTLNQAFSDGQFEIFFDSISAGLLVAASFVSQLMNAVIFLGDVFGGVFTSMVPLILGAAAAYGLYWLVANANTIATAIHAGVIGAWTLVTNNATRAQSMFNAALAFNPIAMVIGLVVGFITALAALIAICEPVRNAFSNAFGYIVDAAEWAVNAVIKLINGGIQGINKVAGFFAGLLGVEPVQIQEIKYKADFSEFKKDGMNFIEDFSLDHLKAKFGLDKPIGSADLAQDLADSPIFKNWNAMQNDNLSLANDNLKGVNDKLDISNEKLELMRDMAEQQVINRFTAATLAPQISIAFTGDIKETADVDGIIPHVEKVLTEQLMIAAEGVYV